MEDRDDMSAYALLNLSIIAKEFFKTMEVQGTVFYLLDKDYSDPAPKTIPAFCAVLLGWKGLPKII
ncbi:MAG: hypothetical protein E3K36_12025 [Candidatus Brocadia sp.]|nr:hypothetical protein [Candidatus Brocadia sp.]